MKVAARRYNSMGDGCSDTHGLWSDVHVNSEYADRGVKAGTGTLSAIPRREIGLRSIKSPGVIWDALARSESSAQRLRRPCLHDSRLCGRPYQGVFACI